MSCHTSDDELMCRSVCLFYLFDEGQVGGRVCVCVCVHVCEISGTLGSNTPRHEVQGYNQGF